MKEPREPTASFVSAVLHPVLRLEVRPRRVIASDRVYNRELALAVRRMERRQGRVEAEAMVEREEALLAIDRAIIGRRERQRRAEAPELVVRVGLNERETVRATAEEDEHEHGIVVCARGRR